MRVSLQPAFILHRRPYRNTSLLLEAFSRDHGRIGLVAQGLQAPRSRRRPLLQPFTPLLLSWSGKGELLNLSAAEDTGPPIPVPPSRLFSGLYVNELLLRLLPRHDPYPGLFDPYRQALAALAADANQECGLRLFERRLLAELGYGLMLECEAVGGEPIAPERIYRYVPEQGPVRAEQTQAGVLISGRSLLALGRGTLADPTVLREVKHLTRAAIGAHLRGKPLKTRELLQRMHAPP